MVGMRARARQCGGELSVTAAQPSGVRIEAVVPLRQ
jgi:signal transduction histidine kinase